MIVWALVIGLTGVFLSVTFWVIQSKSRFPGVIQELREANRAFEDELNAYRYFNRSRFDAWLADFASLEQELASLGWVLKFKPSLRDALKSFQHYRTAGPDLIKNHNESYVEKELGAYRRLFDGIESYPLNDAQREAIVHDEDNNLVLAAAGTGKTSTIVGKVAYLIESKKATPDQILLLAFARKSAEEMRTRIVERIGCAATRVDVHTFHSFGLGVIGECERARPSLEFESAVQQEKLISSLLESCMSTKEFQAIVSTYLAFYLRPFTPQNEFQSRREYDAATSRDHRTLNGEIVKSQEELVIANFLYCKGIAYEYEREYEHPTADSNHQQYRPDFYLSEYGIYLEHFAFDRKAHVPSWFTGRNGMSAQESYQTSYMWKRKLHQQHGTTMVRTYSYEMQEGILIDELEKKLVSLGVRLSERSPSQILDRVQEQEPGAYPRLANLLTSFLVLQRSNQMSLEELRTSAEESTQTARAKAFLLIFEYLKSAYEAHLKDAGTIDFSDMISRATNHINSGRYTREYRYVLIDEFQDISHGRYRLTKALRDRTPGQRLFCVGDDWQSIYRFTGSDISIFVDFERYFGHARTTTLDITYRMNDRIAEFTSRFIQRNPKQLQKKVKAVIKCNHDPLKIVIRDPYSKTDEVEGLLEKLDQRAEKNSETWTVFILGRYRFNRPPALQSHKHRFENLKLDFLTAHGSKGLEADFVIIDDVVAGEYGFPCEIADDPLLGLVLSEPEPMKHAEERRLFYVAATRARHKVFLFTDARRKSPFVSELERDLVRRISCPSCDGGLLFLSRIRQKPFWTCNNYPNCDYCLVASEVANTDAFEWHGLEGRGHICPSCKRSHLVIKHNRDSGRAFWGCNDFQRTRCRYTKPFRGRKKAEVA